MELKSDDYLEDGKIKIIEEIGRGGNGVVYKAEQVGFDRYITIKLNTGGRKDFADNTAMQGMLSDSCCHIVRVFNLGTIQDTQFSVMEYLPKNLENVLKQRRISPAETCWVMLDVLDAISSAHEKGIIHRDIKPSNILLPNEYSYLTSAKVTDFGLAKLLAQESDEQSTESDQLYSGDELSSTLKLRTSAAGTFWYMAPEQRAGRIDKRSDIFSAGVVLYQLLTGKLPTCLRHPSESNPAIPKKLDKICAKALEYFPEDRYQTAEKMREDIKEAVFAESLCAKVKKGIKYFFDAGRGLFARGKSDPAIQKELARKEAAYELFSAFDEAFKIYADKTGFGAPATSFDDMIDTYLNSGNAGQRKKKAKERWMKFWGTIVTGLHGAADKKN
ncbi:serine/threonine protein kinase [Candidatus Woesearchaeota archaeon]|nr:serine/threonine protein kinase [Candidatus Woesearchaeota archaeon]MBW3005475.1 serine/threonine protein kinase [Candidatus Woesearchaeota archaeon]